MERNTQHSVEVVQAWIKAVNRRDEAEVIRLSDPNIEIVGPRGSGYGHPLLREWLNRAHISLETLRTFARDDRAVVFQHGVWRSLETGEVIGEAEMASQFRVKEGRIAQYARYDHLDEALTAARLNDGDELGPVVSKRISG